MSDRGTNYTTEDLRRAFEAGRLTHIQTSNPYNVDIKYTRQYASFNDYLQTLQVEEENKEIDEALGLDWHEECPACEAIRKEPREIIPNGGWAGLPDSLIKKTGLFGIHFVKVDGTLDFTQLCCWQREHDRLLLEEVDRRIDDCRKNWKATVEASIESAVNRIAGAFLEVSEVDYGIGVKTMFRKMAEILEGKA